MEFLQRRAYLNTAGAERELAERSFVLAASLFHHRNGLPDCSGTFKVSEQDHGIREVAGVHGRLHRTSDETVLRDDHECYHALLAKVRQEFMQLNDHEPFLGHGIEIAVQAVNDNELCPVMIDSLAHPMREFTRR